MNFQRSVKVSLTLLSVLLNLLFSGCCGKCQHAVPFPRWIFTHWVWEDESTQERSISLVKDYLERGIPVGAVIIDNPWMTHHSTFEFDPALYPAPASMVQTFHSLGVRVILWITSMINVDSPQYPFAVSHNFLMKSDPESPPPVIEWWSGKGSLLDYFNPDAVNWWHSEMQKALTLSIDGWKCDGIDFSAWLSLYSPGRKAYVSRREYSDAYYSDFFYYTREVLGPDRVITARPVDNYGFEIFSEEAVFAPRPVNFAGWVGDQDATFEGMRKALNNMFYSSRLGYLAFGSDTGGYREDKRFPQGRSRELFVRWAELSAFSPIMENGGGGEHRPWKFDSEVEEIYRFYTLMRYALMDYIWEEAVESWERGISLMRFFHQYDYAYYFGDDILVFPVYENVNVRYIQLPQEGKWRYIFNGTTYPGGSTAYVNLNSLWEFPVFVRTGSKAEKILMDFVENY